MNTQEVVDVTALIPFQEEERQIKITRLFAAPLETLGLDEQIEALAVMKRIDGYLNSKAKKSLGRLAALTESIRGMLTETRMALVKAGHHGVGETYKVIHSGIVLSLTGGAETKVANAARVAKLAEAVGDDAFDVSHTVDIDRLFELNRVGVVPDDVLLSVVRFNKSPSLSKILALKTLGKISDADVDALYDTEVAPVALRVG